MKEKSGNFHGWMYYPSVKSKEQEEQIVINLYLLTILPYLSSINLLLSVSSWMNYSLCHAEWTASAFTYKLLFLQTLF